MTTPHDDTRTPRMQSTAPWKVCPCLRDSWGHVVDADGKLVCELVSITNAHLIAAAPDLERLLVRIDELITWETTPFGRDFQDEVDAVLLKAKGGKA